MHPQNETVTVNQEMAAVDALSTVHAPTRCSAL